MNNNTNYLTSIRGLACLVVVVSHILAIIPRVGINVSGCGKIGVWLFFVLSALLLTFQWINKDEIHKKDVIEFFIKRVFRIFPCYIITLIIALMIGYIPNIETLLKHIFLLEGSGHFWTIPVEFIFYMIVPLLMLVIKKINNEKKSIILLIVLLIIFATIFPYTRYEENSINLKWYIPVFIMGIITTFFYKYFLDKPRKIIFFDIIFIIIMLAMIISTPYFRNLIFKIEPDRYLQNKYLFFGLGWSILIIAVQNSKCIINYLNKSKILFWIGKISFPLYLIHYIVLDKMNIHNILIKSILVLVISIILAIIMNKFIEQPSIKLAKKINNKLLRGEEQWGNLKELTHQ